MKTNGTQIDLSKSILLILFILTISLKAFCQPDYDFRNSTLVSGTDRQIGAVYLFKNVKTGVDATVTILDITGGVTLNTIDGGSGYVEALQPVLQVAPNSSGYVEFRIDFLIANTNTPMVQTEVPATPIDVDGQNYGDGVVKEFDILQLTNGYVDYDMLGGELNMSIASPWVSGYNVAGVDYPGVDTTPKQVMFTTVNASISSFTFRTGATSTSATSRQRLRSVYFKKFKYANSFLSVPSLVSFGGNTKDKKIALQWNITSNSSLKTAIVEKATDPSKFSPVADIPVQAENNSYAFTDNSNSKGNLYYRLKMVSMNGQVSYSNILVFRMDADKKQSFRMYPSLITDNATVNIAADKNEQTSLQLVDIGGRTVYQKKIALLQGDNNVMVDGFSSIHQGTYVAVVKAGNNVYTEKIMIQ